MKSIIITKWIEPYKLLELIKQYCPDFTDYTFDTISKDINKKIFLNNIEKKFSIGLYMKNVNKFYLFNNNNNTDILGKLTELFKFNENDFTQIDGICDEVFYLVDIGKAEAGLIINNEM